MLIYLNVSFSEKNAAKVNGAAWDAVTKRWWTTVANATAHPALWRFMPAGALREKCREAEKWAKTKRAKQFNRMLGQGHPPIGHAMELK